MRKSTLYLTGLLVNLIVLALLLMWPCLPGGNAGREGERRKLVAELRLTDLCLFPEARYTRHLTQTDRYSAFQDQPFAQEHFPSGSLVLPPDHVRACP